MEGMSLEGRRALVTGAAGGIGSAIARDLDSIGADVVAADLNLEGARAVAGSLRCGAAFEVDLTDPASVDRLVQQALAGGSVDILVNCAGWERIVPFLDSRSEDWDRQIAINLRAPIQLCHSLLPGMIGRGWGRIVNISSDAGRVGSSGESVYSACKAGLLGFTKTLARETARKGVTVNAVSPGPTDTPLLQGIKEKSPNFIEALKRGIPVGRLGEARDVSAAVTFLCTPRAEYITGQTLSVNGGMNML
jgi:2-hydroxycyclohexanecarboxyl-CoA dehydrogenase